MLASALLVLCAIQTTTSTEVMMELRDGSQLRGKTQVIWKLKATFGKAEIEAGQLSSIDFGKPDDEVATILSIDGTKLRGTFQFEEIPLQTKTESKVLKTADIQRLSVIQAAEPIAGQITNGRGASGLTYHLRVPPGWKPETASPALIILHGSNTNSKSYVSTIVSAWPDLAEEYILIGINGERRNANSDPSNPTFNYSYVNFVGKRSRFKGYPGTDRESPALVKELVEELKAELKFEHLFVGGHSQGGFLTYSLFMNFPELFDGAFPIASGVIVQVAPDAFDNEEVCAAQRERPLAIVHSSSDNVVKYSMSSSALDSFQDEGFSRVRLFDEPRAGHRFALLPVEEAIRWLETMSSRDTDELHKSAQERIAAENYREAWALLERAESMGHQAEPAARIQELRDVIEEIAASRAKDLLPLVEANENSDWVDGVQAFALDFKFTQAAEPVLAAYGKLSEQHQPKADELYAQSKKEFRAGNKDVAYAIYQEVVDKYYASTWYAKMKRWIEERP